MTPPPRCLALGAFVLSVSCATGNIANTDADAGRAEDSGNRGGGAGSGAAGNVAVTGGSGGTAAPGGSAGVGGIHANGGSGGTAAPGGSAGVGGIHANGGSSGVARDAGTPDAEGTTRDASTGDGASSSLWRPFNDQSPWNTPIANNPPIDPDSATLVDDLSKSMGANTYIWVNISQYSIPVYWADATTPNRNVTAGALGGEGFGTSSTRSNVTATIPIPDGAAAAQGTDAHLCIVDKRGNKVWGLWAVAVSGSTYRCEVGASSDLAGSGVHPPITDAPWWMASDARACGFPLIAGLLTVEEVRAGQINHALALAYPHIRSRYFTHPASTAQGTTTDALPNRGIPCGGHVQLDPSLNLDTLGLSTSGKAIARALQVYGAFVGDYSGSVSLYADSSPDAQAAWGKGLLASDEVLGKIALTNFRLLQMGTLLDNNN